MSKNKPIKPGSRPPHRRWCEWLTAVESWTPAQQDEAFNKALKAWGSGSTQAQYAGLAEMEVIKELKKGVFVHGHHCAVRH